MNYIIEILKDYIINVEFDRKYHVVINYIIERSKELYN